MAQFDLFIFESRIHIKVILQVVCDKVQFCLLPGGRRRVVCARGISIEASASTRRHALPPH